jgi:hypothetical protein
MPVPTFIPDLSPAVIVDRRRRITTPRALHDVLVQALAKIDEPVWVRTRAIRATVELHAQQSASSEKPEILTAISKDHAEATARNLASGLHLLDMSTAADPYVRPMLAYYGCAQVLGAFSRALLRWRGDRHAHGLSCDYRPTPGVTTVGIEERGFFPRLANTLAIFGGAHSGGGYNLFSARDASERPVANVPKLREQPVARVRPEEARQLPDQLPPLAVPKRVTLEALTSHDPSLIAGTVARLTDDPAFDLPATCLLVDVLIVFIAGSLCRYQPIMWRKVLDGTETGISVDVDGALHRVTHHVPDAVARTLISQQGLVSGFGNPYDHQVVSKIRSHA